MTFDELDVNRERDGRFGYKTGSPPETKLAVNRYENMDTPTLMELKEVLARNYLANPDSANEREAFIDASTVLRARGIGTRDELADKLAEGVPSGSPTHEAWKEAYRVEIEDFDDIVVDPSEYETVARQGLTAGRVTSYHVYAAANLAHNHTAQLITSFRELAETGETSRVELARMVRATRGPHVDPEVQLSGNVLERWLEQDQ